MSEDWEALMQGEENHGRKRRADGVWHSLGTAGEEAIELGYEYIVQGEIHGTRSTYNAGCRCPSCRRANRDYRRSLRARP